MLELLYIFSIILSKNVFKYLLKVSDNTFFDFFGNSFIDFYELTSKRFVLELINSTKIFFLGLTLKLPQRFHQKFLSKFFQNCFTKVLRPTGINSIILPLFSQDFHYVLSLEQEFKTSTSIFPRDFLGFATKLLFWVFLFYLNISNKNLSKSIFRNYLSFKFRTL